MPEIPQNCGDGEFLTDEDLRALARRHAVILKRFRARRERGQALRAQRELAYSMARQIAAEMLSAARGLPPRRENFPAPEARQTFPPPQASREERRFREAASRSAGTLPASGFEAEPADEPPTAPIPAEDFAGTHFAAREETALARFLRKIGGGSLAFSLAFHAALIIFALFWVVSVYVAPEETPPTFFASGSGGGRGGERPSYADVQASRKRRAGKIGAGTREHKIVSSAKAAKLVLPEMPEIAAPSPLAGNLSSAGSLRDFGAGTLSSGSGGGLGGGIGKGMGVGVGDARNFVGKFKTTQKILGTNVTASRLAVYMDNSGSMTEVIPVVRKEILKKFPTADVYEFFGCGMSSADMSGPERSKSEAKSWERRKDQMLRAFDREKTKASARSAQKRLLSQKKTRKNRGAALDYGEDSAWRKSLSEFGTELLREWGGNAEFSGMDLGRWLNMVLTEGGYDSVIVFADFQDYRDGALADEDRVLERWLGLARERGQRLYFFTTEMMPQSIFRSLAGLSGGETALPKEVSKGTGAAQETAKRLKAEKRGRKSSVPAPDAPRRASAASPYADDDGDAEDGGNGEEDLGNAEDEEDDSDDAELFLYGGDDEAPPGGFPRF